MNRRKAALWLGLCLSPLAGAYAAFGYVYFTWLEGVARWPAGRAIVVAYALLGLAVLCGGVFLYCLAFLWRRRVRDS